MPDIPMPDVNNMTPEQMQKLFEQMQAQENAGLTPEAIEAKNREKELKKQKNIACIKETLGICEKGSYEKDGRQVSLGLTPDQMRAARVFLPEDIESLLEAEGESCCVFSCENKDALMLACEKVNDPSYGEGGGSNKVLLLNLASAVRPGGGVRDGMGGQEEDLCRASTLLLSLESDAAKPYYEYNKSLHTQLGSDAVIISPDVAVFRDNAGELLDEPFTVAVITCSAPNVRFGFEGKTDEEYHALLDSRIDSILRVAANQGYTNIILGAFGCGVFKNDAAIVSDAFYKALTGKSGRGLEHADFAVLCVDGKDYNYHEFCRNFAAQ